MKYLAALVLGLAISACSTSPQIDVKKRWNKTLLNYSFVPLYPSRGDVDIGDIRIHRIAAPAAALDSRLISDWTESNIISRQPPTVDAVLPGIEAVRLTQLDLGTLGLKGLLASILGTRLNTSNSLVVSLQKLTTSEIADHKVAAPFHQYLSAMTAQDANGNETAFMWGVCAAAKAMDDPEFKDTAISIVTRVIKVGKLTYTSGTEFSNAPDPEAENQEQGITHTSNTALKIEDANFDPGIAIGVDALMIRPLVFDKSIPKRCKALARVFATSELPAFKRR